jgi:hypothetical protein
MVAAWPADSTLPKSGRRLYHVRVHQPAPGAPPFDPHWLDHLVAGCRQLRGTHPRFEDLFLERRLEIAVAAGCEVASCCSEGAAARWRFPSRWAVHAAAGVSSDAVAALMSRYSDRLKVLPGPPPPPLDLGPPPGWSDWARDMVGRIADPGATIRFLVRTAVVIRRGGWRHAVSPALVRMETGSAGTALLAVWGHPRLGAWIGDLLTPPPSRPWNPEAGLRVPVVFTDGTSGPVLHELVGHLAEGDLVAEGRSPLTGLGGATLTEAALDLVDDPRRADLPGAFSCDDEGVAAEAVVVLEGGRLRSWLCDRDTAAAGVGLPGRGRRADWRSPPAPRLSNLIAGAGTVEPAVIESGLSRGLVVTRLSGATVDPVSSRTVLRVERGFELRNGRRRRALGPLELTGSVTEILAGIDTAIGNDPTPDWRLGWCVKNGLPLPTGSEAPTLLIRHLEVL